MRLFSSFLLLVLIAFPAVILQHSNSGLALAQEDEADVEAEDDIIDEEESVDDADIPVASDTPTDEEEEEEDDGTPKKSPDAATTLLFIKPADSANLPAGTVASLIVGFKNNGKANFKVNTMEASFRYPQDFNYFIQNFTTLNLDKIVESSRQASFDYSLVPSENFNGRPFGLVINLHYQDAEGKQYMDAVFNETVMITDATEGFDGETFFLYVTLAALALLVIVALQQTVFSSASKRLTSSKPRKVEMGTQGGGDIDYDWIPKENLKTRKSPRRKPGHNSGSEFSGSE
ncbi:translocon-associated protein subunit alpha-like [Watersipora subatra]|uniref:translocon-associated protein subunit alpha-like n=1 Tax=Watersipora subatra TaxID=2589382 RepID=UPI00355BD5D3